MLIEFRVKNFRSIKNAQVLSMVAAKDKAHIDSNVIDTGVKAVPALVRSAVLYGANASGKSNVINALAFMRGFVADSATNMQLGQPINIQTFRLDKSLIGEPAEFEITFLDDGTRYQYGFALTNNRIYEEWLLAYKAAKPQQWFTRIYNPESDRDEYEIGSHLAGQRKLWQESTRANALFLSTAVQLNSEQLRPIFNWICHHLMIFGAGTALPLEQSIAMLEGEDKKYIQKFLISVDTGITDINIVSRKDFEQTFQLDAITRKWDTQWMKTELLIPEFLHKTEHGSAKFDLHEESLGTQKYFALMGPILNTLKNGWTLVIDELNSSLHPLLVQRLIALFHDPTFNKSGAQLIFTTHDTSLLNQDIFRRDQIWFLEKDREQATTLYPLTDFSPRTNEALERGYLTGRYGAIPLLGDLTLETPS